MIKKFWEYIHFYCLNHEEPIPMTIMEGDTAFFACPHYMIIGIRFAKYCFAKLCYIKILVHSFWIKKSFRKNVQEFKTWIQTRKI